MAGDWIKLQHSVFEAPEVLTIADTLEMPPAHVVGCLARIWSWADQQSENGNALSVTKVTLDRLCGVAGFAEAMLSTGWLAGNDRNLSFPNFERHNGNTAKKRALTAKRVSEHKKRKGNAEVTQPALPREEKRRVSPPTPSPGVSGDKGRHQEKTKPGAWWLSEASTNAYGKSIGVIARPGEPMDAYRERLRQVKQPEAA